MKVTDIIEILENATNTRMAKIFIFSAIGGACFIKVACEIYDVGAAQGIIGILKTGELKIKQ